MSLAVKLISELRGTIARVSKNRALCVTQEKPDVPSIGTANRYRYLTGRLGTEGLNAGDVDQVVNGSVTPVEFYIESDPDYDIFVMFVLVMISDVGTNHSEWGNMGVLPNGFDLIVKESGQETFLIEKAKTGGQLIEQSGFYFPYGNAGTMNELVNWTGGADAQSALMPLREFVPGGLRLGRGTFDRITAVVNDNITVNEQWVRIYGYRHYPSVME